MNSLSSLLKKIDERIAEKGDRIHDLQKTLAIYGYSLTIDRYKIEREIDALYQDREKLKAVRAKILIKSENG